MSDELRDYFASFDLILSYLYDPDGIFEANLRRCGAKRILHGPAKVGPGEHAARQLMRPLAELGLTSDECGARLYPSETARQFAVAWVREATLPLVALHPGSGSETKNWPLERWLELADELRLSRSLLIIGGEAERARLAVFATRLPAIFANGLNLGVVAALIERCDAFLGHDSGISHIAAAVGTPSVLLFGPTDPEVWAPTNENVRVIRAPEGDLAKLATSVVAQELMRIGIRT